MRLVFCYHIPTCTCVLYSVTTYPPVLLQPYSITVNQGNIYCPLCVKGLGMHQFPLPLLKYNPIHNLMDLSMINIHLMKLPYE